MMLRALELMHFLAVLR